MAGIQCKLENNANARRYGTSHNRKLYLSWIINFFKDLVNKRSLILGNVFQMEYLWFIFFPLTQHDLYRVKKEWNLHKIRKPHRTNVYGIPEELCLYPQSRGFVQWGRNITDTEVNDILHYRAVHTEVRNINKRFDQNLPDCIKHVL